MSRPSYFFGGSSASPNKNLLINGNFDVWQRGTSQTTSGYGSTDRWQFLISGGTDSISRQSFTAGQTDVPNNPKYFCRNVVTDNGIATEYALQRQKIEDVALSSGQTLSYSFWAKADSTKDISIAFQQYFGSGGSATVNAGVKRFTLTVNWVKYTGTITMPSVLGKTIGSGSYFIMTSWFSGGSNHDINTNSLGTQSGTFDIAQAQLEYGGESTDFEHRSYGEELALCQRYFEMSFSLETPPSHGPDTTSFATTKGMLCCITLNSASTGGHNSFAVSKRTIPTMAKYGNSQGYTWWGYAGSSNWSATSFYFQHTGTTGFSVVQQQVNNTLITVQAHWTADAEL